MNETRLAIAFQQLDQLQRSGLLSGHDYAERQRALAALLPSGEARRRRLATRPILWFLGVELACKAAIIGGILLG